MRINVPRMCFSDWVPWIDRTKLRRADGPWLGLYLWGRFNAAPSNAIKPYPNLPKQLIYVGETKHLDLRPLAGDHHRLVHYRDTFTDDPNLRCLYVSVCRVRRFIDGYSGDEAKALYARLRVYTQYIESKLYWQYTQRWGRPPALHYKKLKKDSEDN